MTSPLEFRCPSCQQRLSAKAEKAGRRVKCPRCGASLVVPSVSVGQAFLPAGEEPNSPSIQAPPISTALPHPTGDEVDLPAIDLPVIVVGEDTTPHIPRIHVAEPFDPTWVSFPRRMIYVHAAAMAFVLAGAFALGYWVGRDQQPTVSSSTSQSAPIALDGRVTYIDPPTAQAGDNGAVVIALPRATRPGRTEKPSLVGLGPLDAAPADNDPVIEALASLGGAYLRADNEGRFRLVLPRPGEYHLLYVSRHVTRPDGAEIRREHLAEMGEYFTAALELIGRQQYSWSLRTLDAESNISHAFAPR